MSTANQGSDYFPTPTDLEQIVAWAMEINDELGKFRSNRRKTRFIREVFDGADVVFCVWQNPTNPSLFTCKIVKGLGLEGDVNITAFLVPSETTADLMLNLSGDNMAAFFATHSSPGGLQ
jgi:hypothetical protein